MNDFYSTNILDTFSVARHITELDIDNSLANADTSIVDKIAKISINGTNRRFYSFATKYCSQHRPTEYPICDNIVSRVLMYFKTQEEFTKFRKEDLRIFPTYKNIILEFRKFYDLEKFSLREFDLYFWVFGKEYFSPKINKEKGK